MAFSVDFKVLIENGKRKIVNSINFNGNLAFQ